MEEQGLRIPVSQGYVLKGLAEREGFEPPIPVKVCPLSRRIVSTTHAPLRVGQHLISESASAGSRFRSFVAPGFRCRLPLRSRPQPGSISTTHAPPRITVAGCRP